MRGIARHGLWRAELSSCRSAQRTVYEEIAARPGEDRVQGAKGRQAVSGNGNHMIDVIDDEDLAALHGYWVAKCCGRAMPRRSDIDPSDIPSLLPHVLIAEIHRPLRFRLRLVGTAICRRWGEDPTGRWPRGLGFRWRANDDFAAIRICRRDRNAEFRYRGVRDRPWSIPPLPAAVASLIRGWRDAESAPRRTEGYRDRRISGVVAQMAVR